MIRYQLGMHRGLSALVFGWCQRWMCGQLGMFAGMSSGEAKAVLRRYLDDARAAMLWKLDGLTEYDIRRPLTAHGTNLLGLIKHLSGCEIGYFGYVFDRPFPEPPAWLVDEDGDPTRDMWAAADETRRDITSIYRRACEHSNATIAALDLEALGEIPTWPEDRRRVTLHEVLVHMLSETARHAGHADIVRELIDGAAGLHAGRPNLPDSGAQYWPQLRRRIEDAARQSDT